MVPMKWSQIIFVTLYKNKGVINQTKDSNVLRVGVKAYHLVVIKKLQSQVVQWWENNEKL